MGVGSLCFWLLSAVVWFSSARETNGGSYRRVKRPLYDLAMRRGLSSDCCSSALWRARIESPGVTPRGSFIGGRQNYARFRQFFSVLISRNVPIGGAGTVLIPSVLS